jgi:hypothetical protein
MSGSGSCIQGSLESTRTVAQVAGEFRKPKARTLGFHGFIDDTFCQAQRS